MYTLVVYQVISLGFDMDKAAAEVEALEKEKVEKEAREEEKIGSAERAPGAFEEGTT